MTMPPPLLQPYDPTRGLISCFTDDGLADDNISVATAETLRGLLVGIYEDAFRRLPVEDMPEGVDTAKLVDRGGLCLGLLDPVTNIVLNTISLLPEGFETTNPSTPANSGRSRPSRWSSHRRESTRDEWDDVAGRSSRCLLEFMRLYFGMLSEEQACRYLVWARADLAMAILLVEHELYAARPAPPDPRSGRTRNSLRRAAKHVNHPCPDQLVSLATAWLPLERLWILAPILRQEGRGNKLTVHDVKTVLQVLRHKEHISAMTTLPPSPTTEEGTTSCADLGDGRIAYITIVQRAGDHIASLRRPQDMDSTTLSSYSTDAAPPGTMTNLPRDSPCLFVRSLEAADADVCPYVRSLEMSLYGAIHGFYLRALAMLPSHAARQHVRGVLLAGHCYGPMDPVSNILLSAIWYDVNFPLPDADRRTQPHDILDTLAILRAVSRSLHGLVALLHATSGQKLPLHDILRYLSYAQCDISVMLQPHLNQDGSSPNPFVAAATAAEHPQASSMAAFFASLAPAKMDRLRSLMTSAAANNTALSRDSLTQIRTILKEETPATRPLSQRRNLSKTALGILASKRQAYDRQQSLIRGSIEKLLREYARGHPFEPKYKLDFICGSALADHPRYGKFYHVNFMAATKSASGNTLFFAQFMAYHDYPKTSICCALPQAYDTGRCYYGRESARKLAYPDHSVDYFSSTDITDGGLDNTEDTLDTDFLYFDSERDVELAKVLQRMAKQDEARQRSARFDQWDMAPLC